MKSFNILNSKKVKLLILMSLVLTLTLGAYLYRGKEIDLEVDGEKIDTVSYSKTVGEFLEEDEINFEEGAFVNLPLKTKIEDNLNIIIINPKTYSLKQEDGLKAVSSIYETVKDILKDQEIELGDLDYTKPALSEKIETDDVIEIIRVKEETIIEEETIAFGKREVKSDKIFKGESKVQQKGTEGIKAKHIKKRYENGKLVKEELVKEEITKKPYNNIVAFGTKEKPVTKVKKEQVVSRSSISRSRVVPTNNNSTNAPKASNNKNSSNSAPNGRTMMMNASAYDLSYESTGKRPGDKNYGITASGMQAKHGVVAVDPSVIPLGTKLYIEGYGNAVAGDTGGAIKGNRIDLFYASRSVALDFGRRQVKVTILN